MVSWGQQRDVSCIDLRVRTDEFREVREDVFDKAKTMVKVFFHGDKDKTHNVDFIEKYMLHFGEIYTGRIANNFTMYMFPHKVDLEPHVLEL